MMVNVEFASLQLELDPDNGSGIFERLTLTYGLGNQHGLFEAMKEAQIELE